MTALRLLLVASLLLGGPAAAQAYRGVLGDNAEGVPAYLPRGVFLGTYLNEGAVTPQGRVQWQLTLIQMRNDALVGVLEAGGGSAISRPGGTLGDFSWRMTSFYQVTGMLGFGYRATYRQSNLHWGFHIMTGPLLYGASYVGLSDEVLREQAWAGIVEGRAQIGIKAGPITFGVSGGWAQIWNQRVPEVSALYTGGAVFGLFLDWQPLPWK